MSEPSYRVTTEHDPCATYNEWEARVIRLSDGEMVACGHGASEAESLATALAWVKARSSATLTGKVYFADQDGNITAGAAITPESLRA